MDGRLGLRWLVPENSSGHQTTIGVMESKDSRQQGAVPPLPERLNVGHLAVDAVTEQQVLDHVAAAWAARVGGRIVTPNMDIWLRTKRSAEEHRLVAASDLVVVDGMPLVWASRIEGHPIPERVTGSGLVETLSSRAAREGRSLFVVGGGGDGTGEAAGAELARRYPGLRVVGATTPPFGFDKDFAKVQELVDEVAGTEPDLVLVGLGFPKQERLIEQLAAAIPRAWFLGCGAGVQMAAGVMPRSPGWAQKAGAEWVYRLSREPRRLARRYLVDDAPAAVALLAGAAVSRMRHRGRDRRAIVRGTGSSAGGVQSPDAELPADR